MIWVPPPVPGLHALKKRAVPRMLALANAYFNDTVYSGYTVLRIASHDIPFKDYISGMWHPMTDAGGASNALSS